MAEDEDKDEPERARTARPEGPESLLGRRAEDRSSEGGESRLVQTGYMGERSAQQEQAEGQEQAKFSVLEKPGHQNNTPH